MHTLLIVLIVLLALASVVFALGLRRAADGFEDVDGFHNGGFTPSGRVRSVRAVKRKRSTEPRFDRPGMPLKA